MTYFSISVRNLTYRIPPAFVHKKIGIVKEFCKDRGFGLIQPIDESSGKLMDKTIFVHFSEIVQDGRPPLNQSMEDRIKKLKKLTWKEDHTRGKYYLKNGQRVAFEVNDSGTRALLVEVLGDAPIPTGDLYESN